MSINEYLLKNVAFADSKVFLITVLLLDFENKLRPKNSGVKLSIIQCLLAQFSSAISHLCYEIVISFKSFNALRLQRRDRDFRRCANFRLRQACALHISRAGSSTAKRASVRSLSTADAEVTRTTSWRRKTVRRRVGVHHRADATASLVSRPTSMDVKSANASTRAR